MWHYPITHPRVATVQVRPAGLAVLPHLAYPQVLQDVEDVWTCMERKDGPVRLECSTGGPHDDAATGMVLYELGDVVHGGAWVEAMTSGDTRVFQLPSPETCCCSRQALFTHLEIPIASHLWSRLRAP